MSSLVLHVITCKLGLWDGILNLPLFSGCGFLGRHIVCELVAKDVASAVCVVDKVPPQIAWLNEKQTKVFNDEVVTFRSANLINPGRLCAIHAIRSTGFPKNTLHPLLKYLSGQALFQTARSHEYVASECLVCCDRVYHATRVQNNF